jgi:hypothetical protein
MDDPSIMDGLLKISQLAAAHFMKWDELPAAFDLKSRP